MGKPVTMQQIADKAGVSRMTVSRALRQAPEIAKGTCARIQAVAAKLGYWPDPLIQRLTSHLARGRRRNAGETIAWINSYKDPRPWGGQIPFVAMYEGATARAKALGFKLEEFWLGEPGMTGKKLSRILYQRGIECMIVSPIPKGGGHLTMDWEKFSAVTIGYTMIYPRLHRVGSHHLHGAREAIRQLYRRGYRRIGMCMTDEANVRLDHVWLQAMAYHQFRVPRKDWVKPFIHEDFSDKKFLRWLKAERPEGILSQHPWLPEVLNRAGYRVPEDVAVGIFSQHEAESDIAGINQRSDIIGETASDLVIGQHYRNEKGIPAIAHTVMIEGYWMDGRTVARRRVKS